jgi:hypothetical protein
MESLVREFSVLAQLRHPNLLLFLGVTYDLQSSLPVAILTELLPLSVYDLLESQKVRLEPHEILGLGVDITNALTYLHSRKPNSIVHRDLSARNVLLDRQGRAKLADLGQAKVLGGIHSSSRHSNTTMPGAMAYAAPEVLTGRYSKPIDLFSFGVLLAQLCTGEYPRIDKREGQVQRACEAVPSLEPTLRTCLELHPERRPSAHQCLNDLQRMHSFASANQRTLFSGQQQQQQNGASIGGGGEDGGNDTVGGEEGEQQQPVVVAANRLVANVHRHGGDDTTLTHGHGAGVLAERWFRQASSKQVEELQAKLATAEARLAAEMGRWRVEANARDGVEQTVGELQRQASEAKEVAEELRKVKVKQDGAMDEVRQSLEQTEQELLSTRKNLSDQLTENAELKGEVAKERQAAVGARGVAEVAEAQARVALEDKKGAVDSAGLAAGQAAKLGLELQASLEKYDEVSARLDQSLNR